MNTYRVTFHNGTDYVAGWSGIATSEDHAMSSARNAHLGLVDGMDADIEVIL